LTLKRFLPFQVPGDMLPAYREHFHAIAQWRKNVAYGLCAILMPGGTIFDVLIFGDLWPSLAWARGLSTLVCIGLFLFSLYSPLKRYPYAMSLLLFWNMSIGISVLSVMTGALESSYYAGLMLLLAGTALIVPTRTAGAVLMAVSSLAFHFVINFSVHGITGVPVPWPKVWNSLYFLSFMATVMVVSAGLMESNRRRIFVNAERLQKAQHELRNANESLEQTVARRTSDLHDAIGKLGAEMRQREKAEKRIRHMAYYDDLTGLPNRSRLRELLANTLERAQQGEQLVGVCFVDMDNFKQINDTLGHTSGDGLLKSIAHRMTAQIRSSDAMDRLTEAPLDVTVSRFGGDEFVILLTGLSAPEQAGEIASRIMHDLSRPFRLAGLEIHISVSIGIALYPLDGTDVDVLLKHADIAMYHAKGQGRNNFQFFTDSLNAATLDRLKLENDLRKAVERNEFIAHFQPKVDIQTRRVVGMEALVRWNHPERGIVYPMEFIPIAEESGLILQLGEWIFEAACRQLRLLASLGYESLSVSVNLSNRQFEQCDLAERITSIIQENGVNPQQVELEITESTLMRNPEGAIDTLATLKQAGIKVSVDDFGTGYSSLTYLRRLPLDALKVDRSFVSNIVQSTEDATITSTIVAMAHTLRLKVVAEGVETEEQLRYLAALGCDEVQGFLFARPLSSEDFVRYLGLQTVNVSS